MGGYSVFVINTHIELRQLILEEAIITVLAEVSVSDGHPELVDAGVIAGRQSHYSGCSDCSAAASASPPRSDTTATTHSTNTQLSTFGSRSMLL